MKRLLIAASLAMAATSAADAHHSFAMFDGTRTVTLTGTVKEFQWTNPHVWIELIVPQRGKQVQWSIEGGAITGLKRQGWARDSFKAGDKVQITINPLKNGDAGGSFVFAKLANGRTLGRQDGGLVLGRGAPGSTNNGQPPR